MSALEERERPVRVDSRLSLTGHNRPVSVTAQLSTERTFAARRFIDVNSTAGLSIQRASALGQRDRTPQAGMPGAGAVISQY